MKIWKKFVLPSIISIILLIVFLVINSKSAHPENMVIDAFFISGILVVFFAILTWLSGIGIFDT